MVRNIDRRWFLATLTMAGATTALPGLLHAASAAHIESLPVLALPVSYKIGPMPRLPSLLKRPYPYRARHLFSDGHISEGGGFAWSLSMQQFLKAGFSRDIPHGLEIRSDDQKLWFLGRSTFAPELTKEIMSVHRDDPWPVRA